MPTNEAADREGDSTEDGKEHIPTVKSDDDNNQLVPTEKEEKNKKNDEDRWPRLVLATEMSFL